MLKILGKMVIWQSDIRKHQPSLGMAIFLWCFNLLFVALALALLLFDWPLWIRLPLSLYACLNIIFYGPMVEIADNIHLFPIFTQSNTFRFFFAFPYVVYHVYRDKQMLE